MSSPDLLYGQNSIVIVVALFVLIIVANETGYWYAQRAFRQPPEGIKSQTNAIQAGMLGLLALLLGFSFTMALQRFDSRSAAVIEESNAIGTAFLRSQLLPEPQQSELRRLLSSYVTLRVESSAVDLTRDAERRASAARTLELHRQLWTLALEAVDADARPATTGLFVQSLNELIDTYGSRQAALQKHVPTVVLLLLFAIFVISGGVLGYSSGLAGGRPWLATVSMAALIAVVIFIVIDLDRPRRGLIQVDQSSMIDLLSLQD